MQILHTVWQFIRHNWYIFAVAIILFLILRRLLNEFWESYRMKRHQKWLWKQEIKKEQKRQKEEEKERNKYRTYSANNWLYNDILKSRTIVFEGLPGAGKTSGALNFIKFLIDRILYNEFNNRRYYEVMMPKFIKRRDKMLADNKLPFYTNMEGVRDLNTGATPYENAEDIVFQRKKANTPCVVFLDEASDILGKDSYIEVQHEKDVEKRADNDGAKQTAKKLRHYDMWLIMTDQGGSDVVYTVRNVGYTRIKYIETRHELSKKGQNIQRFRLWKNKYLIGWLVSKPKIRFAECLFKDQKVKTFFKLFLRGSKVYEKQFFINRDKIYKNINLDYTVWKQLFLYKDKYYWVYYNNYQTLLYNCKEYRREYDEKFDENGERKKIVGA